jgi:hypothetical protein
MANGAAGREHPVRTRISHYRYFFYVKHHGGGGPGDAQWSEEMTPAEEFAVFDDADAFDLCDDSGRALYGLRRSQLGEVLELGTFGQLVAEFPRAGKDELWHGYPLWPLLRVGSSHKTRAPAKEIYLKMERANLINARDRKRLERGKH